MAPDLFGARFGWLIRQEMRVVRDWGADLLEGSLNDDFGGVFTTVRNLAAKAVSDPEDKSKADAAIDSLAARQIIRATLEDLKEKLAASK